MVEKGKIVVHYSTIDHFSKRRTFATLAGARRFAQKYLGEHPEQGNELCRQLDGVGKITVDGASLADLFLRRPKKSRPV